MSNVFKSGSLYIALLAVFALSTLNPQTASAAIDTNLSLGSSGSDVTELQQYLALHSEWYAEGVVSGYYGSLTERAVQKYQCARSIVCSGTANTTGYGNVGPATRAALNIDLGVSGGSSGDLSAPTMTTESVVTASNSATINWATNEGARSRIMYNTVWPFLYATAPSVTSSTFGLTHSITLTGLNPNTQYYYVRESVDAAGNLMWTVAKMFTTRAN